MSPVSRFPFPFRVRPVETDTIDVIGQLLEGLSGFSVLQSWEDDDLNRHFPFGPWLNDEDAVLVLVKDGCTGQFRDLLLMTRSHAYETGMPRPRIIQIDTTP